MKATRTATIERNGKTTEIKVELTREVNDKIAYTDGANVNLGKETYEAIEITVTVNGKVVVVARKSPEILTRESYRATYDKMVASGAYARLGDNYIGKEMYDSIMSLVAEAIAETESAEAAEFAEVKAAEVAKKEAEFEAIKNAKPEQHGPGWCNKCRSYCWGDCES